MAASPAPQRYYTFGSADAAAKAGRPQDAIKLAAGETLGYQPGKGYFAKPAVGVVGTPPLAVTNPPPARPGTPAYVPPRTAVPTPPVSPFAPQTAAQIDAQASAEAQSQLTPQEQAIQQQQAQAAAQAKAQEDAITGFTAATGGLEAGIAPAVQGAYAQAEQEQGALGQGIGGQVGSDLQVAQDKDAAFAASQGQSGGETTSVPGISETVGMLQGDIPGTQIAAEGAAATTWAAEQPQIAIDAGREELDSRLAQAKTDNDQYATQLIQLAQTYPGLKAQALTQLNQYELDKANYRQSVTMNQNTLKNDAATRANNARALTDQEKTLKLDQDKANQTFTYQMAGLQFKSQTEANKAALLGKTIDVPASKALGHVVYKDGSQNTSIKVAQSGSTNTPQAKAATAMIGAKKTAVSEAISLRGKPQLSGKASPTYLGTHGKYIAAAKYRAIPQGKSGAVYPDGSTNNPKRAAYSGDQYSYAQAQQLIFEKIGGQTLMSTYNLSREQVMAWVNAALSGAGWSK